MTIECPDPDGMAEFYLMLLGGKVTRRAPGWTSVEGGGLLIDFRLAPDHKPPTWRSTEVPMHSHFEFVVEDPDTIADQLLQGGASLAQHQDPADPHIVVLLDPAGHPFCLIRSSVVTGSSAPTAATSIRSPPRFVDVVENLTTR